MTTIGALLGRSLDDRGGDLFLTLDPAFQGLPDTAHGGSVLAAFDALAGLRGPRAVAGVYRKRVPLGVPLALARTREAGAHAFALRDPDGSVLVDGRVAATAADAGGHADEPAGGRAREESTETRSRRGECGPRAPGWSPAAQGQRTPAAWSTATPPAHAGPPALPESDGHPLPISRACFACGSDNPLGLRVRLAFDDRTVWGAWAPREPFRDADGALAPAALTTLLDETAFWLGALATGESGMTTDLRVTLHRPVPFGTAIRVSGSRAAVRPHADDRRYWDTAVAAHDAAGARVASARITFVAVRGAARRLVRGMLAINDADVVRRVFPAYARAGA